MLSWDDNGASKQIGKTVRHHTTHNIPGIQYAIDRKFKVRIRLRTIDKLEKAMEITGIGGLIILIADIYAIVMILQSSAKSIEKLIWSLVVFFLPLIGLIIWYFAGPGKKPF